MRNIVSLILVVVAVLLFALFTNGRLAAVRILQTEAAAFDSALEKSKELIAIRDALLAKYNAFPSDSIERLNTMIPGSIDTVRLIIDINTLASRYSMSLSGISIGLPDEETGKEGALGPSGKDFGRLSLSFDVSATYDRFRAFLGDLEKSLRMIDVDAISFGAASGETGLTTYHVTLTTYWLK